MDVAGAPLKQGVDGGMGSRVRNLQSISKAKCRLSARGAPVLDKVNGEVEETYLIDGGEDAHDSATANAGSWPQLGELEVAG